MRALGSLGPGDVGLSTIGAWAHSSRGLAHMGLGCPLVQLRHEVLMFEFGIGFLDSRRFLEVP